MINIILKGVQKTPTFQGTSHTQSVDVLQERSSEKQSFKNGKQKGLVFLTPVNIGLHFDLHPQLPSNCKQLFNDGPSVANFVCTS